MKRPTEKRDKTMDNVFLAFNERPIAYHRIYTKITGSVLSGVLLSQLTYWGSTRKFKEFYKTNNEISKETGLADWEVKKAKKILLKKELISIKLKSLPRKTYYTILTKNIITLINLSQSQSLQQEGVNESLCKESFTLTTTESTSESTTENKNIKYIKSSLAEETPMAYSSFSYSVFKLFTEKYNNYFVKLHPYYRIKLLEECLIEIDSAIFEFDLNKLNYWETIIDTYLDEFHKKGTDCHFRLFITGETIQNYYNRLLL